LDIFYFGEDNIARENVPVRWDFCTLWADPTFCLPVSFLFDADDFKGDHENRIRDRIVLLAMVFLEQIA
jgi:hypothetical protein